MFHKILFSGMILLVVGTGIVFRHFSDSSDLLRKYQKLGLVQSDLQYEKVEKTWGDQGLIFYRVQFPFVKIPIKADTMTVSLTDTKMNLKLKNIHVKVTEGLKKVYGSEMAEKLNTYVPYRDFVENLLISMAVVGIDEFIGDMTLNTVYSDAKTMRFTLQMEQERQPTLQMAGTIHIPIVGAHQFSDLWKGQIESMAVTLNESLFNRYVNYAKSRHFSLPDSVEQGILYIKPKRSLWDSLKNILK